MNIHNENATWVTDEQLADVLSTLKDAQQIELQGCDVHIGQHPTRGRTIVVASSAGRALVLSERPAGEEEPVDTSDAKAVYARLAADPRVDSVQHTVHGKIRIIMRGAIGFRSAVAPPEEAFDAADQLARILNIDAA